MSQERWDVVVRFTTGPLSYQGDVVCRGPVVRMGAKPGPGGLALEGYRGLDDRQAVVTAYDGGTVSIAPVGTNQVRVAPHENVDWSDVQTIRGPVFLSNGDTVHLGAPGRGCTLVFVEARRLGVWEQGRILSDASQAGHDIQPTRVQALDTRRGIPLWFIPAFLVVGLITASGVLLSVWAYYQRDFAELGPTQEGKEYYSFVDASVPVDPELQEGLNQPFLDFVMQPNADAADWKQLAQAKKNWDTTFLDYVNRSTQWHLNGWAFWTRLEQVQDDYEFVVNEMKDAGLPLVFAAIPYQESRYRSDAQSIACAMGWWQLMPEVANRQGLAVRDCKLKGVQQSWSPTRMSPPLGVMKNAPYIQEGKCAIQGCSVDERKDLQASTRASIEMLAEAFSDPRIADSGAAVQIAILSHNGGYDDSRFDEKRYKAGNLKHAYDKYLSDKKLDRAPDFYGANITCVNETDPAFSTCDGYLWKETQHYAYNIVAQHLLAVCYYGQNYSDRPAFQDWRQYARGDGYCTRIAVPKPEKLRARSGG